MSETRLNATRTILMGSFVKNVKKKISSLIFFQNLGVVPKNTNPGKFTVIW